MKNNVFLKIVGWILIPYVMLGILIAKKTGNKVYGIMSGVICFLLIMVIGTLNSNDKVNQVKQSENVQVVNTTLAKNTTQKSTPKLTRTPIPTPTKTPIPEPTIFYDYTITYTQIAREPDKYNGKGVVFSGKVIQVIESDNENLYRIAINDNYDVIMLVSYIPEKSEPRILKNDFIRFKGLCLGVYTYETVMGSKLTVPYVLISEIVSR